MGGGWRPGAKHSSGCYGSVMDVPLHLPLPLPCPWRLLISFRNKRWQGPVAGDGACMPASKKAGAARTQPLTAPHAQRRAWQPLGRREPRGLSTPSLPCRIRIRPSTASSVQRPALLFFFSPVLLFLLARRGPLALLFHAASLESNAGQAQILLAGHALASTYIPMSPFNQV